MHDDTNPDLRTVPPWPPAQAPGRRGGRRVVAAVVVAASLALSVVAAATAAAGEDRASTAVTAERTGTEGDEDRDDGEDHEDREDEDREAEDREADDIPPFTEPPDGGELQVVESGHSVVTDPETGERWLSWGVVVENTSDHVATWTDVRVAIVDATGARVSTGYPQRKFARETILVVQPGARFGTGFTTRLLAGEPSAIEVEISDSQWVPADTTAAVFPVIEAGAPTLRSGGPGTELTVDTTSSIDEELAVGVSAIVRDPSGQIVGGIGRSNSSSTDLAVAGPTDTVDVRIDAVVPGELTLEVFVSPMAIPEAS